MVEKRALTVVFRVDSSDSIGIGHLRRCLVLADEARRLGHTCMFVCAEIDIASRRICSDRGHQVFDAGFPPVKARDLKVNPNWEDDSLWADEHLDAQIFLTFAERHPPDLVVMDHYFLTQRWVDFVRAHLNCRFIVIEDLERKWGNVEYVVNGNLDGVVRLEEGSKALRLTGSRFCLLSDDYRMLRHAGLRPPSQRNHLLIFAGGGNTGVAPMTYLNVAKEISSEKYFIDLVISSSHPEAGTLQSLIDSIPKARLHLDRSSLASLYANARLALGAGGTSSWERACLGVPSVLTALTENQVPICETLSAHGVARYAGKFIDFDHREFSHLAKSLLDSPRDLDSMSHAGLTKVDGMGAKRVLRFVTEDLTGLRLRPSIESDLEIMFDWANESAVRENSKSQNPITWEEHLVWFRRVHLQKTSRLFLLELDGLPIGQIRFDKRDGVVVLNYSIDRLFRSRGLGRILVEQGLASIRGDQEPSVLAVVRRENLASCRIFEGLGFVPSQESSSAFVHYVLNFA